MITQARLLRHLSGVLNHPCSPGALAKSGRLARAPTELGQHVSCLLLLRLQESSTASPLSPFWKWVSAALGDQGCSPDEFGSDHSP